jgi:hypothetical protein
MKPVLLPIGSFMPHSNKGVKRKNAMRNKQSATTPDLTLQECVTERIKQTHEASIETLKVTPEECIKTVTRLVNPKDLIKAPLFLPDDRCVICGKTIEEVGGKRITAQKFRGITISGESRGGGNSKYPYKSYKLSSAPIYLVIWGEVSMWSEEAIQRATDAFHKGKRSWFCQICGQRSCSTCGAPINYPMGSDVLYENGSNPHCGIFPFDPGCINTKCKNYKEWGNNK